MNPEQFDEAVHAITRTIMDNYLAGDPVAVVDGIFSVVFGPDWRAEVSRTVPGSPEQVDQDAATLFESDVLAGQEWHFGAEHERRSNSRCSLSPEPKVCRSSARSVTSFTHTCRKRRMT